MLSAEACFQEKQCSSPLAVRCHRVTPTPPLSLVLMTLERTLPVEEGMRDASCILHATNLMNVGRRVWTLDS